MAEITETPATEGQQAPDIAQERLLADKGAEIPSEAGKAVESKKFVSGEVVEVTFDGGKTWLKRRVASGINVLTKKSIEPVVEIGGTVFADGKSRTMVNIQGQGGEIDSFEIGNVRKAKPAPAPDPEKIIHKVRKMTAEELAEDKVFWENFDKIKKAVHVPTVEALSDTLGKRIDLLKKVQLGILTQQEADALTKKFAEAAKLRIESVAKAEGAVEKSANQQIQELREELVADDFENPGQRRIAEHALKLLEERQTPAELEALRSVSAPVAKAELTKQPEIVPTVAPTQKTIEDLREAVSDEELSNITKPERRKLIKENAAKIEASDIYQNEVAGLETSAREVGPGYYYINKGFRGEVEAIIGKRKGFPTAIQRMFTFDPTETRIITLQSGEKAEVGPTPWESAVQEGLGRGKEGIEETQGD